MSLENRRRAKKGIKCKCALNEEFKQLGVKKEKLPLTETKYVKLEILSPIWIEIYKDYIRIGIIGDNLSILIIKNKDTVKGFLNYFDFLWKIAK